MEGMGGDSPKDLKNNKPTHRKVGVNHQDVPLSAKHK